MSQYPLTPPISPLTGVDFIAWLVNALNNLVTQSSGAVEPDPTYAYMLWADTANGLLKVRNATNNAWIIIGLLDGTAYLGLEQVANKGQISGYAGLDAAGKVPTVQLGGADADNTKFLRGDQTWATGVTQSLGVNGFCKLDSGFVLQWGTNSCAPGIKTTITLPLPLSTALLNVVPGFKGFVVNEYSPIEGDFTTTNFTIFNPDPATARDVCWQAIGY